MKIDAYKNKKPILVKFFQLTVLLIGSAFFTAQADFPATNEKFFDSSRTKKADDSSPRPRATVSLDEGVRWFPDDSTSSCYKRFELIIDDPNNPFDDDYHVPYQITVVNDNRKVSLSGSGFTSYVFPLVPFISLTPLSAYFPTPDDSFVVDQFEIYVNPPSDPDYDENGIPLLGGSTFLAAFGTLNGVPVNPDLAELELPYYWYPICQIK
jgi:hypothetical protein